MTKQDGQEGHAISDAGPQMAFPLRRPTAMTAERFITSPSNAPARAWLSRKVWPDGRLWLWGPAGTGKTHLLSVWAQEHDATILDARLFSHASSGGRIRVRGNLAIDNADLPGDEATMLHLLNDALTQGDRVLMVGRLPPSRSHVSLPDLGSLPVRPQRRPRESRKTICVQRCCFLFWRIVSSLFRSPLRNGFGVICRAREMLWFRRLSDWMMRLSHVELQLHGRLREKCFPIF